MNRFSLLKIWHSTFTIFVFLLPMLVNQLQVALGSFYFPHLHLPSMTIFLVGVALLWSVFTNHVFLPGLARGRVYWKNFALMLLQCYLAVEATFWFHHYWIGKLPATGRDSLQLLLWGFCIHVWMFVYSVPLILLCLFVNGYVLKFLYERRVADLGKFGQAENKTPTT